ncbi:MAG TPA: chemotaxis protein CheW [Vicinamibacterales bacterium]|nr:chemotaxis protein CheW [Vicinamibacterales bacterium]
MHDACWNTIGVHGDGSCPELATHVHCRNCPVYSAAALTLLDRAPAAADIADWTGHFARTKAVDEHDTQSVVIFRIGHEWLALPAPVVEEVADLRAVHSLPHRRGASVLGLTNVRGELLVCVSLSRLLNLERVPVSSPPSQVTALPRLLVIRRGEVRAVCPTDEVHGMHRCRHRDLLDVPTTVAKTTSRHAAAVLPWRGQSVGLLDAERLFETLERSLA